MKKILLVSVVLALLMALVLPSAVMAAKPVAFSASGIFKSIDEGIVTTVGIDSTYGVPLFDVQKRHIYGEFVRSCKGEANRLNGPFTITYNASVNAYQIGTFSGILKAKSATFTVNGTSYGVDPTKTDPNKGLYLSMGGDWTGTKGIKAAGTFEAYFYFIPIFENGVAHVGSITESSFVMTGDYDR